MGHHRGRLQGHQGGEVLQRRQVRGRHHHHRPDRDCLGRAQLQRCHPHPPHPGLLQEALLRRALSLASNASPDLFPETSSLTVFSFFGERAFACNRRTHPTIPLGAHALVGVCPLETNTPPKREGLAPLSFNPSSNYHLAWKTNENFCFEVYHPTVCELLC